jgi:hypothetical protein
VQFRPFYISTPANMCMKMQAAGVLLVTFFTFISASFFITFCGFIKCN